MFVSLRQATVLGCIATVGQLVMLYLSRANKCCRCGASVRAVGNACKAISNNAYCPTDWTILQVVSWMHSIGMASATSYIALL